MLASVLAIGTGAVAGALSRWGLGVALNAMFPSVPPGTLAANWIGAYLIGIAIAAFAHQPTLAPEWRLLVVTGFLGSLTTFSTFSAEVVTLVQQGRLGWAGASIALHVAGSVLLTLGGIASVAVLTRA
jgi:CrcB protein